MSLPLKLFISYSHRDESFKNDLMDHLSSLIRAGQIKVWQDRDIDAGAEWNREILTAIDGADIILMLVTARFMASEFCFSKEMQRAMAHHDQGSATVVPVIASPCRWQDAPFSRLQVLPKDGKAIADWGSPDAAYTNVVSGLARLVNKQTAPAPADDGWGSPPPPKTTSAPKDDGWGGPPVPPPLRPQSTNTAQRRMALFQTLSALPVPTFDAIVFALKVPPMMLPPGSQGQRVPALLNWAETPLGCGLDQVEQVMQQVMGQG